MRDDREPELIPFAVPSDRAWFDPRLMMAATEWKISDVALPNNVVTVIASPNPLRVYLGFAFSKTGSADLDVTPWPDWTQFQGWLVHSNENRWFSLFEWGQLVCQGWYTNSVGVDAFVRVIEILRK